jgi:hypothetical protein
MSVGARILKWQLLRAYARVKKIYCQIIWDNVNVSTIAPGYEWTKNFKPVKSYTAIKTRFWVKKAPGWPQPPWLRYRIYTSPDGGAPTTPILADVMLTLPTLSETEWTMIEFDYDPLDLVAGVNYRDGLRNAGNAGYPPWYYYKVQTVTHYYPGSVDLCPSCVPGWKRWWYSPTNPGPWEYDVWAIVYQMIGYT